MNREIEEGNSNIRWDNLKKLKQQKSTSGPELNLHDFANFYRFFKELYAKNTLDSEEIEEIQRNTDALQDGYCDYDINEILNSPISPEASES